MDIQNENRNINLNENNNHTNDKNQKDDHRNNNNSNKKEYFLKLSIQSSQDFDITSNSVNIIEKENIDRNDDFIHKDNIINKLNIIPTDLNNNINECCYINSNDLEKETNVTNYRIIYLNNILENNKFLYACNKIVTSHFTIYTFLPKILFYEFSKMANAYFLIISILQTIKTISNTGGFPSSLPALTFIIFVDMFFAAFEDYKRHKADNFANQLPCKKLNFNYLNTIDTTTTTTNNNNNNNNNSNLENKDIFLNVQWNDLKVGDIIKLNNHDSIPADVIILATYESDPLYPQGICYVETKSLDGETNLKLRQGIEATYALIKNPMDLLSMKGKIICEKPNSVIHRFCGSIELKSVDNEKNDIIIKEVLTSRNMLLRGSILRNTEYVYALVINTGPDTKIMMSSKKAPVKWSNMEKRLNKQILYICLLMFLLCFTGAIAATIWNNKYISKKPNNKAYYLYDKHNLHITDPTSNFFILFLYYFLLLNSFIPVSLYVSMTSVKFMQAYFMNSDIHMYYEEADTPCQVRSMCLNEELGQIDYVFSDKTGTLTCNIMEFRKCSINGMIYGTGSTEIGLAAELQRHKDNNSNIVDTNIIEKDTIKHIRPIKAPYVNFLDDSIFTAIYKDDKIKDFFEHLSLCHTVMPEKSSTGEISLSASSPDEQALVAAAGCFGFKFIGRSPGEAHIQVNYGFSDMNNNNEMITQYKILEVLEFTSNRKRMSTIIQKVNGELVLLCKGADTVIYERLNNEKNESIDKITLAHLEQFASEGLRTLVIAYVPLKKEIFEEWRPKFIKASNNMVEIEKRKNNEPNEIDSLMDEIEKDLILLGATAIEDKLQDKVPDTISKLLKTNIKVWMLTGDKEETAINIGYACELLTSDMDKIIISYDRYNTKESIYEILDYYQYKPESSFFVTKNEDCSEQMDSGKENKEDKVTFSPAYQEIINLIKNLFRKNETYLKEEKTKDNGNTYNNHKNTAFALPTALIIDGESLELALEECPILLLNLAKLCVAVIACRAGPAQKAQLVQLVRTNIPEARTLAIGDGANDVCMIQAAHVGIGIQGQEGSQATNSSDYAIGQFYYLQRLLFVHGRWNYLRMAKLILYIFYKNVMMNLTQYTYMLFYTGFSGQKWFLEWGLQSYNLFITSVPIILVSVFEQDVPDYLAIHYPKLYEIGQLNKGFNTRVVWSWIISCIWESSIISLGTIYGSNKIFKDGETTNMWVYGCIAFTTVIIVVNLKLAIHQIYWHWIHFIIYFLSICIWLLIAGIISSSHKLSLYWCGVFTGTFIINKQIWLIISLLVITTLLRDFFWKAYRRMFYPTFRHLAQEVHFLDLKTFSDLLLAYPPLINIPDITYLKNKMKLIHAISSINDYLSPKSIPLLEADIRTNIDNNNNTNLSNHTIHNTNYTSSNNRMKQFGSNTMDQITKHARTASGFVKKAGHTIKKPFKGSPKKLKLKNSNINTSRSERGHAFSYDDESYRAQSFMVTDHFRNSRNSYHIPETIIHSFNNNNINNNNNNTYSYSNQYNNNNNNNRITNLSMSMYISPTLDNNNNNNLILNHFNYNKEKIRRNSLPT